MDWKRIAGGIGIAVIILGGFYVECVLPGNGRRRTATRSSLQSIPVGGW
jgi:hypothetical protein